MGIVFSCFNIKDHPTENSSASNSEDNCCFRNFLHKCNQLIRKNEFQATGSAPTSPTSETTTLLLPPQASNDMNTYQIRPHNAEPKPQSSEPHAALSIPNTTQVDDDPLLVESQCSESYVANSIPAITQLNDINFIVNSTKICSSSCSKKSSLPKLNNQLHQDLILLSSEEEECPTCLEEYDDQNPKIMTECLHHFHLSCIYDWMERSDTCPICSRVMVFHEVS